jgi:hypothetical protein
MRNAYEKKGNKKIQFKIQRLPQSNKTQEKNN